MLVEYRASYQRALLVLAELRLASCPAAEIGCLPYVVVSTVRVRAHRLQAFVVFVHWRPCSMGPAASVLVAVVAAVAVNAAVAAASYCVGVASFVVHLSGSDQHESVSERQVTIYQTEQWETLEIRIREDQRYVIGHVKADLRTI